MLPNTFDDVPEGDRAKVSNPESFNTYLDETLNRLNALGANEWAPPLDQLDAMAQSITISPTTTAGATSDIIGKTWQWVEFQDTAGVNDITVDQPDKYTLTLQADGQYTVQADCNRATGAFSLNGSSLALSAGPTTLAECGPESLSNQYLQLLGDVVTYVTTDDGRLVLNLKLDAGNMFFRNSPE